MQLYKSSTGALATAALATAARTMAMATAQSASSSASLQQDCSFSCLALFDPVCASDGETYSNDCAFDHAVCESGDTTLSIVSRGECSSGDASSEASSDGSSGEDASDGCLQEFACVSIYDPVCGDDNETYGNECELKRAQCTNATLEMASTGECGASADSDELESLGSGSLGGSGCSTSVCTGEYMPICGSNGVTYGNECLFLNAQCDDASLTVESDGECPASSTASSTSLASGSADEASSTSASTAGSSSGAVKSVMASAVVTTAVAVGLFGLVL